MDPQYFLQLQQQNPTWGQNVAGLQPWPQHPLEQQQPEPLPEQQQLESGLPELDIDDENLLPDCENVSKENLMRDAIYLNVRSSNDIFYRQLESDLLTYIKSLHPESAAFPKLVYRMLQCQREDSVALISASLNCLAAQMVTMDKSHAARKKKQMQNRAKVNERRRLARLVKKQQMEQQQQEQQQQEQQFPGERDPSVVLHYKPNLPAFTMGCKPEKL